MGIAKTALKLVTGFIVGFVLLCIVIAVIAPDTPEQNVTKVSGSIDTPIIQPTNTQDQEWLSVTYTDTKAVANALTQLGNDLQGVSTYGFQPSLNSANTLFLASSAALSRSESMTVSNELLPAKADYEASMAYFKTSAYYVYESLTDSTNGNYAGSNEKLNVGTTNLNLGSEYLSKSAEHLKTYKAQQ